MARGWESKSVESQMEEAAAERRANREARAESPAEAALGRKRDGLLLERTRILTELQKSRNPRYRTLLGQTLAYVDSELEKLDGGKQVGPGS